VEILSCVGDGVRGCGGGQFHGGEGALSCGGTSPEYRSRFGCRGRLTRPLLVPAALLVRLGLLGSGYRTGLIVFLLAALMSMSLVSLSLCSLISLPPFLYFIPGILAQSLICVPVFCWLLSFFLSFHISLLTSLGPICSHSALLRGHQHSLEHLVI
jgi:hypothetical protein